MNTQTNLLVGMALAVVVAVLTALRWAQAGSPQRLNRSAGAWSLTGSPGRRKRLAGLIGLGVLLAGALALVLVLTLGYGPGRQARAAVEPGLDFSIGVGSQCDSSGTPTATCDAAIDGTFTVSVKVNALGATLSSIGYVGYDATMDFTGLAVIQASLTQQGAGTWPACEFTGFIFSPPGHMGAGCAVGISAPPSTYTGVLLRINFQCPSTVGTGTITLAHGDAKTDLVDSNIVSYSEGGADESLTINCVAATHTPTATPTATPGPQGESKLNITKLGQYRPPRSCYRVFEGGTLLFLFQVCDNTFQGPPALNAICVPDGVCGDEDSAAGSILVTLSPGAYDVQENVAPFNHTLDPNVHSCSSTSGGMCDVTVIDLPAVRPWFPWDTVGAPDGGPDGKVTAVDILDVVQHYSQVPPN